MPQLQILIPQYHESEAVITPLLTSIALQQGIDVANDVGVIICNDGSDTLLSPDFLNGFPFPIQYMLHDHHGLSATRNACLDAATADYVMFCDADDMFIDLTGMQRILRKIDEGFNVLLSVFYEENRNPETRASTFLLRENQTQCFVHGKLFNRQFLLDNHLWFNESLEVCEDCHFIPMAVALAGDTVEQLTQPFYLWRWNDHSITRRTGQYRLESYNDALRAHALVTEEWLRRGQLRRAQLSHAAMMYGFYADMNRFHGNALWEREYRDKAIAVFRESWNRYKCLLDSMSADDLLAVRRQSLEDRPPEDPFVEHISIIAFERLIKNTQEVPHAE